jgi:hypothetical protein
MKTFKTKLGTEIPIMDLKGKDYIQVAYRVVWFREDHPKGRIDTQLLRLEPEFALFKADICDIDGTVLATAHGREDFKHFQDAIEKAETKAVGRALALCGYGTAHAPEFDERERVADAPLPPTPKPAKKEKASVVNDIESIRANIHSTVLARKIPGEKIKALIAFRFAPKTKLAELDIKECATLLSEIQNA